jgi:sarcosine oxidase delta subunit
MSPLNNPMKKLALILLTCILLAACGPSPEQQATNTATVQTATAASWTSTPLPTAAQTLTFTPSPTATFTPTNTLTPIPTLTPSITPTATYALPTFTVNQQAFCRYGPSKAYLPAADLYAGDKGQIWGRSPYNKWLWVQLDKLKYQCWVAPSVIDVVGDTTNLWVNNTDNYARIPSELYGPPTNVRAVRNGDQVTITWDSVYMTTDDDRGYFIEAWVCQNGAYIWWTVGEGTLTDQYQTTYTITDQAGCSQPSSGKLFTVEKHGYTTPVDIPWPAP